MESKIGLVIGILVIIVIYLTLALVETATRTSSLEAITYEQYTNEHIDYLEERIFELESRLEIEACPYGPRPHAEKLGCHQKGGCPKCSKK